jgi:prevent-host-death family protein
MIRPDDIHPLTEFQRNAKAHIRRLRKTRRPQVLTVNGRAAVVVQDATAFREMFDLFSGADEIEGIRKAFRELDAGKARPLEEFAREFRARHAGHRRRKSA